MKIATNINRDAFGGITISNLALFDWLEDKDDTIVGIEFVTSRHFLGAVIFRRYQPSFFSHHVINSIDVIPKFSWERAGNLRKRWSILIETTKNILRQEAPDILLINGTYFVPWILATAAHELDIPVVLRYAGVLQKEVSHKNFFVRRRLLAYEKWIASTANAIIFPSNLCKTVVEKEILGHSVDQSVVIPNPAKNGFACRQKTKSRYSIAAVGRWSRIKNFQSFIALHNALLKKKFPHRAIMVTSFWDKKFDIPETIERKEPMSQEDLFKFYKSIDLLIVPSFFETFCNVAAEALVNGTSILVSKNVGFAETLRKAGLKRMVIDSFDDPDKVALAVKRLLKNKLSEKERKKVVALLNPQQIHQNILEVLNKVIKGEKI
ncbi:MAG: glycosyltransferase family 4 protein [Patescibacteria group bacterium]|jgi:glycosyltransferase involved in cell wall biosynthesis